MTLKFHYHGKPSLPVEVEGFTPDWASDKTLDEIQRFQIWHGKRKIPLAELFQVSGNACDKQWEFSGDLTGVHWIGAHMASGCIRINGSVGRHTGSDMRGGEIDIQGNTQDWLGAEMHGGLIHVQGNAGSLVGAAYRGAPRGMTGGTILIQGNAGNEIGSYMRRGLIAVGGSMGELVGFNMLAGTLVGCGECGIRPGAGMRRGTIILLGSQPPALLPSFRYAFTGQPVFLPVLWRELKSLGFPCDESLWSSEMDFYQGDFVSVSRGEIVLRHTAQNDSQSLSCNTVG